MAIETERKFLIKDTSIVDILKKSGQPKKQIVQGYLASGAMTVRVRVYDQEEAWLTLKGPSVNGSCEEFEYPIPISDANRMLYAEDVPTVKKTRYKTIIGNFVGDLDVYHGQLQGFMTLEIELNDISEEVPLPSWVGEEVTGKRKYHNDMLAKSFYGPISGEILNDLEEKLKQFDPEKHYV